jgi:hypothetical protein
VIEKLIYTTLKWIVVLGVIAGLGLLLAFPIMWTWNYIMPYLFNLPTLTWGMAWCLNFDHFGR